MSDSSGLLPDNLPAPRVRLVSIPAGWDVYVRFLGPVYWIPTHWTAKGSAYCFGQDDCPAAVHRSRCIWKGYAAVQSWVPTSRLWRSYCLEVTEELGHCLKGHKLRGQVWSIHRELDKGKRSPVKGHLVEEIDPATLPDEFELEPVLWDVYRITGILLRQDWPLRERLCLKDEPGPAPKGIRSNGRRERS